MDDLPIPISPCANTVVESPTAKIKSAVCCNDNDLYKSDMVIPFVYCGRKLGLYRSGAKQYTRNNPNKRMVQ